MTEPVYKKEFFIVELKNYEGLEDITVRELIDQLCAGLGFGLRYISIVSPDGVNRAEQVDLAENNIELSEYIIVVGDDDKIDIEKTAKLVAKDFILNGMIICMRNAYEEVKQTNGSWIDKILEDD